MLKRIFLSPPYVGQSEKQFMLDAFDSGWIAPLGPNVDAFEQELAAYIGIEGAVALNSGTSAIHLALKLIGIAPGDIVFCSSFTFVASANPIVYEKAIPVFIDSDTESWNMSVTALRRAFEVYAAKGKLPKAVIVVNLYGQSADYDPIIHICREYSVPIIEDSAESLGATYKGKYSGTLGDFGIFSFNGNKIITTSGGGMLVSNNKEKLRKARFYSTQACEDALHYQHNELGYNYRLSNILAAIGRGQLKVLDDRVTQRRRIYDVYSSAFSSNDGFNFMPEAAYGRSNRWLTALTINTQKLGVTHLDIIAGLATDNIESRPVWKPLHLQPLYNECDYYEHQPGFSVSDQLFQSGLCLPSGSNMSEEDMSRIIGCIKQLLTS
jgi:pyridoxal phosphate-dependent aminotransferase EpsN